MTLPAETPEREPSALPDDESRMWLERLGTDHPGRDAALAELHGLLLRAARFEVNRRRATLPHLRGDDHEDLAHQSADDALTALLGKLSDFRGESRFTTWAYKFALLEAAVKVRRRAWQGREIPLEDEAWSVLADASATAQHQLEDREALAALREEIDRCLTDHQRRVLVSVTLNDVPIDVLAQRLETTRGALYKTLHDARRKLRAALDARGYEIHGFVGGKEEP
ncbi:MAG: sigma-70 family RNA polymerase sigma factor [Solirubrobacterales bacterium]